MYLVAYVLAFGAIDEVKRLREPKAVDTVAVKGEDRGAEQGRYGFTESRIPEQGIYD